MMERPFNHFLLAGEMMGAAGLSTGAKNRTAVNPVRTAKIDRTSPKMRLECDNKVAINAMAGNTKIVIIAQRQGDSQ